MSPELLWAFENLVVRCRQRFETGGGPRMEEAIDQLETALAEVRKAERTYAASEVAQLVEQERLRAVAQFRDALQNSHKAMCDAHSTVKFYLEREMNAPAHQKLRAYEAAIFAMQKILDAPNAQAWLEQHDRELLKQKEIDVAKHISKAALDGCQCEPCLAAKKLTEQHDRQLFSKHVAIGLQDETEKMQIREEFAQRLDALTKGWDGECCKAFDCGDESCGTLRACANEVREIAAAIRSHTLPGGEK